MKNIKILAGVLVLGLVGSSVKAVVAPTTFKLTFKLSALQQDLVNSGSPIEKSTVTKKKATNADLLDLLAEFYNTTWDKGTTVALDLNGDFVVLGPDGFLLDDATSDGAMNNLFDSEDDDVFEGTFNINTAQGNFTDTQLGEITYTDVSNGNVFALRGVLVTHNSFNEDTGKFSDSFSFDGQGDGEVDGSWTVFTSASVKGSAKGVGL